MVWRAGGRAELQVAMLPSRQPCQQQALLASKAVDMNARDTDTFRLVQTVISSSSSSSSSDSMQEDKEEEAAPHALEERHTGPWTKTMLVDRLKRRCDETDQRRPPQAPAWRNWNKINCIMRTNSLYPLSFGTSVPYLQIISPDLSVTISVTLHQYPLRSPDPNFIHHIHPSALPLARCPRTVPLPIERQDFRRGFDGAHGRQW